MSIGRAKGIQLVVFRIAKEYFGVSIGSIREIVRLPEITEVPDAPEFLEGMINLRGRIVPVIDLKKRLRLRGDERTKATRVLITDGAESMSGLIVDSVDEVIRVDEDEIEEPPEIMTAIGIEFITGVAKVEDRLIILLDLKRVMSPEDMKNMSDAAREVDDPVNAV